MGVNASGEATFKGAVTATSLNLGTNQISTDNIAGLANVATSGNYSDLNNKPTIPSTVEDLGFETGNLMYKGDVTTTTKTDSDGVSYTEISVPTSDPNNPITYASYSTDKYLVFGRGKEGDNIILSTDGLLTANNAIIYGTVYATNGEFTGKIIANEGNIGGHNGFSIVSN
jgi:hypothetical protein